MIQFTVSIQPRNNNAANEMMAVVMNNVATTIKNKAQQLNLSCNTDVNVVLNANPISDT